MSNPRGRSPGSLIAQASQRARLPGLSKPRVSDPGLGQWIDAVTERMEVREGARGNDWERVLTRRDLRDELTAAGVVMQPTLHTASGLPVTTGLGGGAYLTPEAFADSIRNTKLYRDLLRKIDDPARFDDLPAKTRALLLIDIAEEAEKRGAEVRRLDEVVQDATNSFAQSITEVTAAVQGASAGVRRVEFAAANANRATAGVVTQVQARLDDFDGGGATVEEYAIAIADRATGLEAQKVFKVTAGGAMAGIGLGATSPVEGNATSAIIMLANKVAFVGTGDTIVDPLNPDPSRVPFGIDTVNDVIYINGQVRINAEGRPLDELGLILRVSAPTQTFKQDAEGTWDASSITLTATLGGGLTGTVNWSVVSGSYGGSTASGSTLAVARTDMSTDQVTFRATVTSGSTNYTDDFTIVKLVDGENVITGFLTNEAHSVPSNESGVVSSYAGAAGVFNVFRGTSDVTTSSTFSVQDNPNGLTLSINASTGVYSVTASGSWSNGVSVATVTFRAVFGTVTLDKILTITKSVKGVTGDPGENAQIMYLAATSQVFQIPKTGSVTPSSITLTANGQNLSGSVTWSVLAGSATLTGSGSTRSLAYADMSTESVTIEAEQSGASDTITIVKVREGVDTIAGFLTNESHTVPAGTTGVVSSYAGAGGTFKVFDGLTDVTTSATFSVQTNTDGLTTSINASTGVFSVTATGSWSAALNVTTITYRAVYGSVTIDKVFTLTKAIQGAAGFSGSNGSDGTRGSVTLYASGGSWSDSTANSAITSATGSSTKVIGDTVTISNGSSFAGTKYWSGSAWVDPGVVIDGNLLVNGTISAAAIGAGVITTDKLYVNAATVVEAGSNVGNTIYPTSTFSSETIVGSTAVSITSTGAPVRIDARVSLDLDCSNSSIDYYYTTTTCKINGVAQSADQATQYTKAVNVSSNRRANLTYPVILRTALSAGTHTILFETYVEARDSSGSAVQFGASSSLTQYATTTATENKV